MSYSPSQTQLHEYQTKKDNRREINLPESQGTDLAYCRHLCKAGKRMTNELIRLAFTAPRKALKEMIFFFCKIFRSFYPRRLARLLKRHSAIARSSEADARVMCPGKSEAERFCDYFKAASVQGRHPDVADTQRKGFNMVALLGQQLDSCGKRCRRPNANSEVIGKV